MLTKRSQSGSASDGQCLETAKDGRPTPSKVLRRLGQLQIWKAIKQACESDFGLHLGKVRAEAEMAFTSGRQIILSHVNFCLAICPYHSASENLFQDLKVGMVCLIRGRKLKMNASPIELQLKGWSLTTAEITYRMPDHRSLLQSFIWQEYDLAPRFPQLIKFLDFWSKNLDGPVTQVRVAHSSIIGPAEMRMIGAEWQLQ